MNYTITIRVNYIYFGSLTCTFLSCQADDALSVSAVVCGDGDLYFHPELGSSVGCVPHIRSARVRVAVAKNLQ